MPFRIATWNINSIRLRMPLLKVLAEQHAPDIICLQETKVDDPLFPLEDVRALGFAHVYFSGQPGYNGVAVLSRLPLTQTCCLSIIKEKDRRHIAVRLPNGVELHNFYVPAGGDIPDREANPAYGYKLDFVDYMRGWFKENRNAHEHMILVGDLNIAPLEHDVWSHRQLLKIVSHTPAEVERLNALQTEFKWVDVARHFTPTHQKLFSWWSYRNRDWRASDRGRRLDHIWVTEPLKPALLACHTFKDARDWPQPSDHVPVLAEFNF